jgi:putative SOS response-associated peptidase YedK
MCGRTRVTEEALGSAASYARKERQEVPEECSSNENCCPGTMHAMIGKGRELRAAVWGLITPWDKKVNHFALFNGRSETFQDLPSFANTKRGIIFVDGFYEWKGEGKTGKQPHYIYLKTGKPMMMAVAYNYCQALNKNTFSIMTRASYGGMQSIHTRQPLLLSEESAEVWLNGSQGAVKALVASNKSFEVLEKEGKWHPVTSKVGKPAYKGEDCSHEIDTSVGSIKSFFSSGKKPLPPPAAYLSSSSSPSSSGGHATTTGNSSPLKSYFAAAAAAGGGGTTSTSTSTGKSNSSPLRSPAKPKPAPMKGPMARFLVQQQPQPQPQPAKREREGEEEEVEEEEEPGRGETKEKEEGKRATKAARPSSPEVIDLT